MRKGAHLTISGVVALVAQIKSYGQNEWRLRGVIIDPEDGVMWLHSWTIEGQSHSGNPDLNLRVK